jgi:hypothetical protein
MPGGTFNPGDQVNCTDDISEYLQNPGTVQPDQGDGLIRILWADGFSLSVLSPSDAMLASLQLASPPGPSTVASDS